MWLNSFQNPTQCKKKKLWWTNQYCWRTICQIQKQQLYARQNKVVLGIKTTIEQYNCYFTHNFTSMLGCNKCHQSKKPKIFCNKNKVRKAMQTSPICLTESGNNLYLLKPKLETQLNMKEKQVLMRYQNK